MNYTVTEQVINFYRLYGTIFYTIDKTVLDTVYYANTSDDYNFRLQVKRYIPSNHKLTDSEARKWFMENYPNYIINKVNKHYHTEYHSNGDKMSD